MKKAILITVLVLSAGAYADEDEEKCRTEIKRSPNPFVEVVTIPFKAVAAFTHLPRCIIENFPTNPTDE